MAMLSRLSKIARIGSKPDPSTPPPLPPALPASIVTVTHQRIHHPVPTTQTEASKAADLMKQAVQLKKEKWYDEACELLRSAFEAGGSSIGFSHRLRLPSYLVLAGRNDDAWSELNRLNLEFVNPSEQAAISSKMAAILAKEGRFKDALLHECWSYAMDLKVYRDFVDGCVAYADKEAEEAKTDEFACLNKGRRVDGKTPSGNPIHDCSYSSFAKGLKQRLSSSSISAAVRPSLKKAGLEKQSAPFFRQFGELLKRDSVSVLEIRSLISSIPC